MSGILGGLLESTIRKEMKNRIDEILRCGREWDASAKELKTSIDKLAIEFQNATAKGVSVDPAAIKNIIPPISRLCKFTGKLERAFNAYGKTMTKISEKL
jgi:hypothetical protein